MLVTIRTNKYVIGTTLLLLGGAFIYIYKNYDPMEHSFFPACPIKALTGFDCPGCGSQRAIHAILNGNFKAAVNSNPLIMFLIPYLILNLYFITRPFLTAKQLRWRNFLFGYPAMIVLSIITLLFTILRNLI